MNKGNNIFGVLLRVLLGLVLVLSLLQVKMKFGWDPLKKWSCDSPIVNTDSIYIKSVTLPKDIQLVENGSSRITALITPTNASNTSLLWSSSDTTVVNVDSTGLVTAMGKAGICKITAIAKDGSGKAAVTRVHVTKPKESIVLVSTINSKDVNRTVILKEKDTYIVNVNVFPENANNKKLSWKSSDTSIATVNASGVVTAIKPGSCIIKIRSTDGSGVVSYVKVIVEKAQAIKASSKMPIEVVEKTPHKYVKEKTNDELFKEAKSLNDYLSLANKGYSKAYYPLAYRYYKKGEYSNAKKWLNKAIKNNINTKESLKLKKEINNKEYKKQEETFNAYKKQGNWTAIQKMAYDGYSQAYAPLAIYYLEKRNYDMANKYAEKAIGAKVGMDDAKYVIKVLRNLDYYR